MLGVNSVNEVFLCNADNNPLSLFTNNTRRLYITADGKVGIGTTTPSYTLDVEGNGNFSGGLIVKNGAYSYSVSVPSTSTAQFSFSTLGSPPTGLYAYRATHDALTSYASAGFFMSNGNNIMGLTVTGSNALDVGLIASGSTNDIFVRNVVAQTRTITLRFNRLI